MKVRAFEPDMPARTADSPAERADDADRRVRARTSDTDGGDERMEEPLEEPGYGHGV